MTNMELKKIDGFYWGIYSEYGEIYRQDSIYVNLDFIYTFSITEMEEDRLITVDGRIEEINIPAGSHEINLNVPLEITDYPCRLVIHRDLKEELERLKRILTEKLCVK